MAIRNRLFSQDVETIIWKLLSASAELKSLIKGGIYKDGFRPTNSKKEDICINTISLTQDNPQIGLFNINVYTKALKDTIDGMDEYIPDSKKLSQISDIIKDIIEKEFETGAFKECGFTLNNQQTIKNQDITAKEFYQNIRLKIIIPQNQ